MTSRTKRSKNTLRLSPHSRDSPKSPSQKSLRASRCSSSESALQSLALLLLVAEKIEATDALLTYFISIRRGLMRFQGPLDKATLLVGQQKRDSLHFYSIFISRIHSKRCHTLRWQSRTRATRAASCNPFESAQLHELSTICSRFKSKALPHHVLRAKSESL